MVPQVVEELQRSDGFEALAGNECGEVFQAVRISEAEGYSRCRGWRPLHRSCKGLACEIVVRLGAEWVVWHVRSRHVHEAAAP